MATDRERFKIRNTLICLLKAVEGNKTVVELRNESNVAGLLEHVDGYMNITMSNVCFRNFKGKVNKFETFFIQGANVRYVHIPDEIDMRKAIDYQSTKERDLEMQRRQEISQAALDKIKKKQLQYQTMLKKKAKQQKDIEESVKKGKESVTKEKETENKEIRNPKSKNEEHSEQSVT